MNPSKQLNLAVVLATSALIANSLSGQTTTMSSGDSWVGGVWDNGEPDGATDAVIADGVFATANGPVTIWDGNLTMALGSQLSIAGVTADFIALSGAQTVFMNGATIINNWKSRTVDADWVVAGDNVFDISGNSAWNQDQRFAGVFSGDGTLSFKGGNHQGLQFLNTNTFTGGVTFNNQNQRYGIAFNAPGAAGAGDVTVAAGAASEQAGVLVLNSDDVFSPTATLALNGSGWGGSNGGFGPFAGPYNGTTIQIDMKTFSASVGKLILNGVEQPTGTYTGADGEWISGEGILTVTGNTANPGNELQITEFAYDPATTEASLSWNSQIGASYTVKYSFDLVDWSSDLEDSVLGDEGSLTTRLYNFTDEGLAGEKKIFFRIERM